MLINTILTSLQIIVWKFNIIPPIEFSVYVYLVSIVTNFSILHIFNLPF